MKVYILRVSSECIFFTSLFFTRFLNRMTSPLLLLRSDLSSVCYPQPLKTSAMTLITHHPPSMSRQSFLLQGLLEPTCLDGLQERLAGEEKAQYEINKRYNSCGPKRDYRIQTHQNIAKMVAEKHRGNIGWSLFEFICTNTKIKS